MYSSVGARPENYVHTDLHSAFTVKMFSLVDNENLIKWKLKNVRTSTVF